MNLHAAPLASARPLAASPHETHRPISAIGQHQHCDSVHLSTSTSDRAKSQCLDPRQPAHPQDLDRSNKEQELYPPTALRVREGCRTGSRRVGEEDIFE